MSGTGIKAYKLETYLETFPKGNRPKLFEDKFGRVCLSM